MTKLNLLGYVTPKEPLLSQEFVESKLSALNKVKANRKCLTGGEFHEMNILSSIERIKGIKTAHIAIAHILEQKVNNLPLWNISHPWIGIGLGNGVRYTSGIIGRYFNSFNQVAMTCNSEYEDCYYYDVDKNKYLDEYNRCGSIYNSLKDMFSIKDRKLSPVGGYPIIPECIREIIHRTEIKDCYSTCVLYQPYTWGESTELKERSSDYALLVRKTSDDPLECLAVWGDVYKVGDKTGYVDFTK